MSVISFRGAANCLRVTESAAGWIVSRRRRHIVTSEIETGADMPTVGRISTFPSIRGYGGARVSPAVPNSANVSENRVSQGSFQSKILPTRVADIPG